MTKLRFFLVSRIVAVGMAVGTGAAIIPASAAPDDDARASEASIPRTISYDGDDAVVLIGMPGRTLVNLGIAGSNYFGFGGDGIQRGLPTIPLEPSGSGYGSPADFLASPVGMDWLQ
jgi:hypothetical protein